MPDLAKWITEAIKYRNDDKKLAELKTQVTELARQFPLPHSI
jgi:glycine/serine hydroxymethyltransferase